MAGIYFHIPFCKRACAYCDFYKQIGTKHIAETLSAMRGELRQRQSYLKGEKIGTIYFGGGTPSLCSPRQIDDLMNDCAKLFDCSATEEITLEANPDDLTEEYLRDLRSAGINRLSMGIQSFDDACLKLMNRRHTAAEAIRAVETAQKAGFDNISTDLIFGVPGFGGEKLKQSIRQMLALGVQHISAYHLTIEPNTFFGRQMARGEFSPVKEEVSEEEFLAVHHALTDAGYEHYEISNFALEGRRARHNAAYWHGVPYLGIGPAAHSFDGSERHWNISSVEDYLEGAEPEAEELTARDHYNEYLMTRLRTIEGIDLEEVERMFGHRQLEFLMHNLRQSMLAHRLSTTGTHIALKPEHFLVSDLVIKDLFDVSCSTSTQ